MKKILTTILLFSALASFSQIYTYPQNYSYPLNMNKTFLNNRNINMGTEVMVPVAITSIQLYTGGAHYYSERFAISWYSQNFSFNNPTKIRIYNSITNFENDANGVDITGLQGVEALSYDKDIHFPALYAMETENGGGTLKIFDYLNNPLTSYTSGDVGTALGAGFNNARGMAFDNSNDVYITDDGNDRIVKIKGPRTKASAVISNFYSLPTGSSPKSVAIRDSILYVACFGTNKVLLINLNTQIKIGEISTGSYSPLDLTVKSWASEYVYVSQLDQTTHLEKVIAINAANTTVETYTDFGTSNDGPWGMNVNGKGDLYCSDGSNGRIVKYARTRLSDKDIMTYSVDSQIGNSMINTANKTVTVYVPTSYDLQMVHTHYLLSPLASAIPEPYDYRLAWTDFSVTNPVDYTVTAEDGSTQIWKVTLVKTTGIQQIGENNLQVYPNPATNWVNLKLEKEAESNAELTISNLIGQTLYAENIKGKTASWSVKDWAKGIYLLNLKSGENNYTQKIIVE